MAEDMGSLAAGTGTEMYALMERLYPICRSITGEGFRETQSILGEWLPELQLAAVPTGTQAFDWQVPREWNIKDAYIITPSGEKIADFKKSNLHVVNYSIPKQAKMTLEELRPHLHTLPEHPQWIPYRTSYYKDAWGFCLTQPVYDSLEEGTYEVFIDTTLEDGHMNYGECLIPGQSDKEVLLTAHACHPSLCNDNLSGVVIVAALARLLAKRRNHFSYRVLFLPGGVGSVVWLHQNQDRLDVIHAGIVASCLGDSADFTYKKTRQGNALIDQAAQHALKEKGQPHRIIEFSPYGYDERNFCSPDYDLPVSSVTRSSHSGYPGYHSSGDDLSTITPERLEESLSSILSIVGAVEANRRFITSCSQAEPMLGKRGLYGSMGGLQDREPIELALLWVNNLSDGRHSILDIASKSGYSMETIQHAASLLLEKGVLSDAADGETLGPDRP